MAPRQAPPLVPPPQAPTEVPALTAATSPLARLTRRAEFLRVASTGRKIAMPGLVLQVMKRADQAPLRLGFTVTKKVGNAVIRNRTKRRLRAAARLLLGDAKLSGADLVLIGRDKTRARPFALLIDDLRQALTRNGLPPSEPKRDQDRDQGHAP
jgi:ribonuclease P protein component